MDGRRLKRTSSGGPNIWLPVPAALLEEDFGSVRLSRQRVAEIGVFLGELAESDLPNLPRPLIACPPEEEITGIFACLVINLQRTAGADIQHWTVLPATSPQRQCVATELVGEKATELAATLARLLIAELSADRPIPMDVVLPMFRRLCTRVEAALPHLNARAIINAARRRGIPVSIIDHHKGVIELGNGTHRRRINGSSTSCSSEIAGHLCRDKALTNRFLREAGLPAPESHPVRDAEMAVQIAREIGYPVAVKPRLSMDSSGVSVDLVDDVAVREAFRHAASCSDGGVIVESFVGGREYRATVVAGKTVAVVERQRPFIVGDGAQTVAALIAQENTNPRRGTHKFNPLKSIEIDDKTRTLLHRSGLSSDAIPAAGEIVVLKPTGHISAGGAAIDRSDDIHPDTVDLLRQVTRVLDIDVAGIDFIVDGAISESIWEAGGAIIEVNSGPGYWIHEYPSEGSPRDIGSPIVDMLFPPGSPVRVPIVAVTRSSISTAIVHQVAKELTDAGHSVGLAAADALFVAGTHLRFNDPSEPWAARKILNHPDVEIAVIEVDPDDIHERGLPFQYCDVALVTAESDGAPAGFPPPESVVCRLVGASGHIVLSSDARELIALRNTFAGTVHLLDRERSEPDRLQTATSIALMFGDDPAGKVDRPQVAQDGDEVDTHGAMTHLHAFTASPSAIHND